MSYIEDFILCVTEGVSNTILLPALLENETFIKESKTDPEYDDSFDVFSVIRIEKSEWINGLCLLDLIPKVLSHSDPKFIFKKISSLDYFNNYRISTPDNSNELETISIPLTNSIYLLVSIEVSGHAHMIFYEHDSSIKMFSHEEIVDDIYDSNKNGIAEKMDNYRDFLKFEHDSFEMFNTILKKKRKKIEKGIKKQRQEIWRMNNPDKLMHKDISCNI